jgi:hypothetical protein
VIVNVGGKDPGSADFTLPGPSEVLDVLGRIGADWKRVLQQSQAPTPGREEGPERKP